LIVDREAAKLSFLLAVLGKSLLFLYNGPQNVVQTFCETQPKPWVIGLTPSDNVSHLKIEMDTRSIRRPIIEMIFAAGIYHGNGTLGIRGFEVHRRTRKGQVCDCNPTFLQLLNDSVIYIAIMFDASRPFFF